VAILARRSPIGPAWLEIAQVLAMEGSTLGALRERMTTSRAGTADVLVQQQLRRAELASADERSSEWAFTVLVAECGQRHGRGG